MSKTPWGIRPDGLGNWAGTVGIDPGGPNIAANTMNERGAAAHYAEELERVLRIRDTKNKELEARIERAERPIEAIASGQTGWFPGAPDILESTDKAEFRGDMWTWSQGLARKARRILRGEET